MYSVICLELPHVLAAFSGDEEGEGSQLADVDIKKAFSSLF